MYTDYMHQGNFIKFMFETKILVLATNSVALHNMTFLQIALTVLKKYKRHALVVIPKQFVALDILTIFGNRIPFLIDENENVMSTAQMSLLNKGTRDFSNNGYRFLKCKTKEPCRFHCMSC